MQSVMFTRQTLFLQGQQKFQITKSHQTHALQTKSLQNPDFEAIYHFSVNSYHTSVERKSIPYQSSFIVLKFQRNRTKPELIIIFLRPHFPDLT